MIIRKIILSNVFVLAFIMCLSAQDAVEGANGSILSSEYHTMLKNNLANERSFTKRIDRTFSVVVHVFPDSVNNEFGIEQQDFIDSLNKAADLYFSQIGVNFNVVEFNTYPHFPNSYYEEIEEVHSVTQRFETDSVINFYIVDAIGTTSDGTKMNNFGFTYYPDKPDTNHIHLIKDNVEPKSIAQLLGNFFGLLNTYELNTPTEFVNGKNCENAGDYICGTYADIFSGLYSYEISECIFNGLSIDANGDFYAPTTSNLMSSASIRCRCKFTEEQYRRMKYYIFNYRDYLK